RRRAHEPRHPPGAGGPPRRGRLTVTIIKVLPPPEYCPGGRETGAPPGESICEALLENGVGIEHACEMSCACTTCHVVVREGFASLGDMDESEEGLVCRAWRLEARSPRS